MNLRDIIPAQIVGEAERSFVVGMTGSGKTTLVYQLLRFRRQVLAFDPKIGFRPDKWRGWKFVRTVKQLERAANQPQKFPKIVYQPNEHEMFDPACHNAFFELVYKRENCTCYVDEMILCTFNNDLPFYYKACLTQGRAKNIEMINGTQRPMNIPQWTLSEAEHFYVFRLQLPQDREKIGGLISLGRQGDEIIKSLPKRRFLYYSLEMYDTLPLGLSTKPIGLKLNLPEAQTNVAQSKETK